MPTSVQVPTGAAPNISNTTVVTNSGSSSGSLTVTGGIGSILIPSTWTGGAYTVADESYNAAHEHRTWSLAASSPSRSPLYPLPFSLPLRPAVLWHFRVWDAGREDRSEIPFYDLVYFPLGTVVAEPLFRSRTTRARFLSWWNRYSTWFPAGPGSTHLPSLSTGRCGDAAYVEHTCHAADSVYARLVAPRSDLPSTNDESDLALAMTRLLPTWSWIAGNCRRPVRRVFGGYVFSRAADAAKFMMAHGE